MKGTALASLSPQDERLLLAAIGLAQRARDNGNHPFGALLAAPSGDVLCEAENTVVTEGDVTGHAELNLVSKACRALTASQITTATLYTSTEPCAMCSGAIYWSRIPHVVYALGEDELAVRAGPGPDGQVVRQLPTRPGFAAGYAAAAVHKDFWT
jgi:tRNA(Arg) A34 adenosine deaminase TadA